jgi:alpha-galactosidase
VRAFYQDVRDAAGSAVVIGCNTIGHIGAGLFELQRTGDDTSGQEWERTRKMGVNTLAFRMCQHNAFFAADADCVGLTEQVPWDMNRQWLELLAGSGTPLFVSASPAALGREQSAALKRAFALASEPLPPGEPLDWLDALCPGRWLLNGEPREFDWYGTGGLA